MQRRSMSLRGRGAQPQVMSYFYRYNENILIASVRQLLSSRARFNLFRSCQFLEMKRNSYIVLWLPSEMLMVSSAEFPGCVAVSATVPCIGSALQYARLQGDFIFRGAV